MAGRSRVAAVLPEQAAACPASLPDGVLLLAAGVGSRGAEEQHCIMVGCWSHAAMGGARWAATIVVAVAVPHWSVV